MSINSGAAGQQSEVVTSVSSSKNGPSFAVTEGQLFEYYSMTDLDVQPHHSMSVEDGLAPELMRTASMGSSVFTLTNCILGSGTLAMAYAAKVAGVIPFILMLLVVGVLATFSVNLLVRSADITAKSSYDQVGFQAIGKAGFYTANICVIIQQFGACIAYIKIIGDVITPLVSKIDGFLSHTEVWQVVIVIFIIFPLTMLRRMESLKYSAGVAISLILGFVVIVIIDSLHALSIESLSSLISSDRVVLVGTPDGILRALPLMAFAFVCHMNVFPTYKELREPTEKRMTQVGAFSCLACYCVYMLSGLFGYFCFNEDTEGDLVKSYANKDSTKLIVNHEIVEVFLFGIGMALTLAFPVLSFELRHCLDTLMFGHKPFSMARHTALNVAIVGISLIIALAVPGVTTVFGFTGSTTSCMVVFIMPAAFYLYNDKMTSVKSNRIKQFAVVEMIIGIALMPLCLVVLASPVDQT